MEKDPR